MKRKNEAILKTNEIQNLSDYELIKFIFNRESLFRTYELHHATDKEEARQRINSVLHSNDISELCKEFRICFDGAIELKDRPSYYFNLFIIDLIERYYSDFIYNQNTEEIKSDHLFSEDDPTIISYEWILNSKILNSYQRYLIFEYLALGYSLRALAKRRYCTVRTIENHLAQIIEVLDS